MNTRKALDAIPDKTLNRLLIVSLSVITLALVFIAVTRAHHHQALEMRQLLATLMARDVRQLVITPDASERPATEAGARATIITSPAAIEELLTAYQQASSYGPGGGRFTGGWQAQVDLHLRTGRLIHSMVYQNDYASLLFIAYDGASSPGSPEDCLMSQSAGHLVERLSSQRP